MSLESLCRPRFLALGVAFALGFLRSPCWVSHQWYRGFPSSHTGASLVLSMMMKRAWNAPSLLVLNLVVGVFPVFRDGEPMPPRSLTAFSKIRSSASDFESYRVWSLVRWRCLGMGVIGKKSFSTLI